MNHYATMFFVMVLSGLLSTMNVWVDKVSDMRLGLNDVYMILLMTGWMLLFMGWLDGRAGITIAGIVLVAFSIWCIRTQTGISVQQYMQGMIPHHSMAIHMSKKLLSKPITSDIQQFAESIITQQEKEITYMKHALDAAIINRQFTSQ